MTPPDFGDFPLSSTQNLPNVTVAFPGEHWSDGKASEVIVPGECVVPLSSGGKKYWQRAAASGVVDPRASIALRTVQIPDTRSGGAYGDQTGPNAIMNTAIKVGEYVHAYRSGAFHLTLFEANTYVPGDLLAWDPNAVRANNKGGNGAWKKTTNPSAAFFEVDEFRTNPGSTTEGILTVKSLRSQF
jgi:predicted RecA/RadA family phage recombinase